MALRIQAVCAGVWLVLGLSACTADLKQGWFACSDGKCPPGQTCESDGLCHNARLGSVVAADGGAPPASDSGTSTGVSPRQNAAGEGGAKPAAGSGGTVGGAGSPARAGTGAGGAGGAALAGANASGSGGGGASPQGGTGGSAPQAGGGGTAPQSGAGANASGSGGSGGAAAGRGGAGAAGMAGMVGCSGDQDCVSFNASCKVGRCDLANHTCSAQDAAERSACNNGADLCKAGRCVQCIAASDCDGDPGICKQFECTANNTCSTHSLDDRSSCRSASGRSGVCSKGACIGCVDSSDCAKVSPSTPVCVTGTCAECASPSDCSAGTCRRATCSGGFCGQEITAWASCATGRVCNASGACAQSCGNGHLDAGEECEIGVAGWDFLSCDSGTCQRLTYRQCTSSRDCEVGCASGGICGETCSTASDCPRAPPNVTATCYEGDCALACDGSGQCPMGLTCVNDPLRHEGHTGVCLADTSCVCEPAPNGCSDCLVPLISD